MSVAALPTPGDLTYADAEAAADQAATALEQISAYITAYGVRARIMFGRAHVTVSHLHDAAQVAVAGSYPEGGVTVFLDGKQHRDALARALRIPCFEHTGAFGAPGGMALAIHGFLPRPR